MVTLLSKFFIKAETSEKEKRNIYGILCGVAGIIFNLLLFVGKFFIGLIGNSVSIMADAFNNLSDAGSSVITMAGFKLAGQKPDADHPYGHGRFEYISGLVISAIIIVMGFELLKESISKIIHPEETVASLVTIIILIVSILVKIYMAYYNNSYGKIYNSAPLKATAMDSLSDCIATGVVLVSTILSMFTNLNLDGYCGLLVSLFIFYAGISAGKEAIDPLLGTPPNKEYIQQIEDIVLNYNENIVGMHDLMVHDYGPGRQIISLHAEVPCDGDLIFLHDIIDNLEKKLSSEMGLIATIHMDPVDVKDPKVIALKDQVSSLVKVIDDRITIHDFRVVFGDSHTNIIFDLVLPFDSEYDEKQIKQAVNNIIAKEIGKNYFAVIGVDRMLA